MCPSNRVSDGAPSSPVHAITIETSTSSLKPADSKMLFTKSFVLPVVVFVAIPTLCIVTYVVSVLMDHVAAVFPYISETGTYPPESCIFSQVLNVTSFIMLCIVYIKYHQVRTFSALRPAKAVSMRANTVAAGFGTASCIGLNVVANFQESNVLSVHLLGAGGCFFAGTVYFCLQTSFSHKMCPEINALTTVYLRATVSVLCCVFTATTTIPGAISLAQFTGPDRKHWLPEQGGYPAHLVSTVSEWLLAIAYISFILSFCKELRQIHVRAPTIILLNVEPENDITPAGQIKTIAKAV